MFFCRRAFSEFLKEKFSIFQFSYCFYLQVFMFYFQTVYKVNSSFYNILQHLSIAISLDLVLASLPLLMSSTLAYLSSKNIKASKFLLIIYKPCFLSRLHCSISTLSRHKLNSSCGQLPPFHLIHYSWGLCLCFLYLKSSVVIILYCIFLILKILQLCLSYILLHKAKMYKVLVYTVVFFFQTSLLVK